MKASLILLLVAVQVSLSGQAQPSKKTTTTQVKTANGLLEGVIETSGIRSFKGIPFAQPPVGELRWKAPQPVKNWTGVRQAD